MTQGPVETSYDERRHELLRRVHVRRHELAGELVETYRAVIAEYRELVGARNSGTLRDLRVFVDHSTGPGLDTQLAINPAG